MSNQQQLNPKINLQDFSKGITKMLSNPQQKLPKYLEFLIKSKKDQVDDNSSNEANTKGVKPTLTEQYKQFVQNIPAAFSFNSPSQKQNSNQHHNDRLSLNAREKCSNSELKNEKKIVHISHKSSSNYHSIVNQAENKAISNKDRKRKKKNNNAMSLDTADFQALKKYFQYQENSQKKERNSAIKRDSDQKKSQQQQQQQQQQRNKQEKYRIVDSRPNHKKKQSEDLLNCQKKNFQPDRLDQKQSHLQTRKKQLTIHDFNNIVKKELASKSSKDQNLKTLNINLFDKTSCIARKAIDLTQSTKSSSQTKPQQFHSMTASSLKQPAKRSQQQQYTFTKNSNLKLNNFVEMAREQQQQQQQQQQKQQSDLIKTSTNKLQIKQFSQLTDTNSSTSQKKFSFIKEPSTATHSKKKDNINSIIKPKTTEQDKLQDKLMLLENKILSVKTNLDGSNQQNNSKKLLEGQFQSKSTIAAQNQILSFPQQNQKKIESNNDKNNNLINLFKKINSNINKQSNSKMSIESKDLQSIKLQNEKLSQYLNKIKTQQEAKKSQLNKHSKECPELTSKSQETHHARNHTAQIELQPINNNTTTTTTNNNSETPQISQLVTQVKLGSQQFSQLQSNQPQTCSPPSPEQSQPNSENYSEEFIFGFQELYYVGKLIESFLLDIDDYFVLMFRDHFLQSLQTLHFLQCMEEKSTQSLKDKKVTLGSKDPKKKTLILDLDETLIHCNESLDFPSDIIIPIQFPTGEKLQVGVNIRPYTRECLKELNNYFEIVIFTASHSCYANKVLDYLDPKKNLIKHRLFRENCVLTPDGFYVKDLDIFEDRDINEMIIVDNAVYSFAYHLGFKIHQFIIFYIANGIPILPFYDNPDDTELNDLTTYLMKLVQHDEIAKINQFVFKLKDYHKFMNPVQLLETLYPSFLEDDDEEEEK